MMTYGSLISSTVSNGPPGIEHREGDVRLPPLHLVEQLLIGRRLGELHLDARALGHEAAHEVGRIRAPTLW